MSCYTCRRVLANNLLVILTLTGVVLGFALGASLREASPSDDAVMWIGMPGEVYLRMLKMVILPLIICSVITGTASLDPRCNGKVSVVALSYIVISNLLATIVPMAVTLTIRPGHVKVSHGKNMNGEQQEMRTGDVFADLIRNLFPPNVISACFEQIKSVRFFDGSLQMPILRYGPKQDVNGTSVLVNVTQIIKVRDFGTVPSTNVIGLVICCLVFGMASASLGSKAKPFYTFFHSANEVIIKVLCWFVWITPLGVASLIAVACLTTSDLGQAIQSLGVFALIVLGGLLVHQLVVVPLAMIVLLRTNSFRFLLYLGRPWMVAFATASSAMAIPETLESLKTLVDPRISRFVVPFATTINRDGSCIFISVATLFVTQLAGHEVDASQVFVLWILSGIVAMATPSVPSASLVTIILILTSVGIPADMVGLLFATEWILDRFRSGSNVLSHVHCSLVTHHFCKRDLPPPEDAGTEREKDPFN